MRLRRSCRASRPKGCEQGAVGRLRGQQGPLRPVDEELGARERVRAGGDGQREEDDSEEQHHGRDQDRFAPIKKAEGGDYVGAAVSDFSLKATTKSFNKSVHKGTGFGGPARASRPWKSKL